MVDLPNPDGDNDGGFNPQMEIKCEHILFCPHTRKCELARRCLDPGSVVPVPDYSDSTRPIRGYGTASKRRSRD